MGRKWSPRSKLLAGLSVVCALAAFLLVHGYARRLAAMEPGAPVPVVVAAADLARGTTLTPEMLASKQMPSSFVPSGAMTSMPDAAGRKLNSPLAAGEVITHQRIGGLGGPVAALVPDGLRAVILPTSLPAETVSPGDRVDVLATYEGGQPYTETTAEGLEVLETLRSEPSGGLGAASGGYTLVLLTDPDGAERLAHAIAFARIEVTVLGSREVTGTQQPASS